MSICRTQCFEEATGKLLWRLVTPKRTRLPKGAHFGHQHPGTKKHLVVLAAGKEPKELAKIPLGAPIYSTLIVGNGVLYVASQRYLWAVQRAE